MANDDIPSFEFAPHDYFRQKEPYQRQYGEDIDAIYPRASSRTTTKRRSSKCSEACTGKRNGNANVLFSHETMRI